MAEPMPKPEDHDKRLKLDSLIAIRESAYDRWEKRRSYEWQLSISIWTALTLFSGLVLRKEVAIDNRCWATVVVLVLGGFIIGIQAFYLYKMIQGTLGDAELQRWAEKRMYNLAFDGYTLDGEEKRCNLKHHFYGPLGPYGLYLQVGITTILVLAAACAVFNPPPQNATGNNPPTATQVKH